MAGMPVLTMANNADFIRTIAITVGSLAYDLTDHEFEMEVRARPAAAETFISLDTEDLGGIVIENPPIAGLFSIYLPAERLLRMPPGDYTYDVILIRPDGFRQNLGINTMQVVQGITR